MAGRGSGVIGPRVAVAPGRHAVRVACTTGGTPRLLAELPTHLDTEPDAEQGRSGSTGGRLADPRARRLCAALRQIVGQDVAEVVIVHPPGRPPASVQRWLDAATAVAPRFRRVAAPVAATVGTPARAVLDVGRSGAEATLLQAGRIVARRSSGVGGDRLDLAVRALLPAAAAEEARRVREALSLRPEVRCGAQRVAAEQVRAALAPLLDEAVAALAEVVAAAGEPVPVVLTGGVARCPLLAERVDAAGFAAEVRVAPRPDLAAVLGALALGPPPAAARAVAPGPAPRQLPAPPPVGRGRRWGSAALVAALLGGLAAAGTAVAVPVWAPPAAAPASGAGVLVQYGYRLDLPPGWEHTGGLPERRRVLLTRAGAPQGTDLIAVERTPLGYDAGAEPERAAAEMRAVFDESVAEGAQLTGYGAAEVGGRAVTTYRQREHDGAVVEWYVVLEGDAQLSVGCRHTQAGTDAVRAACAVVVGSVRRA
ncbi:MAG TPA: type VII secretion-associated protein [Pseudonocardia sp.]|nr:type VII secretion-associated protein [Pseudonocardia sp.]